MGMEGGNVAVEVVRVRMVTLKFGSERRAVRMGVPTEPVAPRMMMFLRGKAMLAGVVWCS